MLPIHHSSHFALPTFLSLALSLLLSFYYRFLTFILLLYTIMLRRCTLLAAICLGLAAAPCQSFVPCIPRRPFCISTSSCSSTTNSISQYKSPDTSFDSTTCSKHQRNGSRRGGGFRTRVTRTLASLAFAIAIVMKSSAPALAAPKDSIRANDILMNSLKPGISAQEAEQIDKGELVEEEDPNVVLGQASSTNPGEVEVKTRTFKKKQVSMIMVKTIMKKKRMKLTLSLRVMSKRVMCQKEWLDGGSQGNFRHETSRVDRHAKCTPRQPLASWWFP